MGVQESWSPEEKFQHTIGTTTKKPQRIRTLKRVRRVLLYPHHPSPKVTQLKAKKELLGSDFSHRDKVSKHPASPDVGDTAHEAYCFLPHTREKWGLTVTRI